MTYIDEYIVQTIGSKWNNGKEKKNQVITETKSNDGIDIKKLCRFVEEYEDNLTNGYTNCKVQITFTDKEY